MKPLAHDPISVIVGYQARLIGRVNLLVALLISILLPFVMFLPDDPDEQFRVFWILTIVEQFTPLLGITLCSDIFSTEWEKQTADNWLAKSYPRTKVLLSRFSIAATLTLCSILLIEGQFYFTYVNFSWTEFLVVTIPGTIFLGTIGMLTGIVFKNSAVAYLIPLAYWAFEMSTKGKYTGILYLFMRTSVPCQSAGQTCMAIAQSGPWLASKLLILLLTISLILVTAYILERAGRKWGK